MTVPTGKRARRRRLGLLLPSFSASEEDWSLPFALDLVRLLAAADDVRVFALRQPPRRDRYRVFGAEVITFGDDGGNAISRVRRYRRVVRTIAEEHRSRPFDLLHAFWAHEPGALGALAAARAGVPLLVSILGGELVHLPAIRYGGGEGPLNRNLVRFALSRARLVTAGSKALLDEAARRVPRERLERAPLGVDPDRFFPSSGAVRLEGSPALLNVASLVPVKGLSVLLESFARLVSRFPGAVLHLVGEGPERERIRKRAAELGLQGAVRLHGAVPHVALPAFYRGADLFVLSSLFESQCMAALEAAACGTPVAGTAVGILPEIVPAEQLATPGDSVALGRAIEAGLSRGAEPRDSSPPALEEFSLPVTVTRWRGLHARLCP